MPWYHVQELRNLYPNLRVRRLTSIFFPRSFIVFTFIVRSLVQFELIFVDGVSKGVNSLKLFIYLFLRIISALFVEKTVFFPLNCLGTFT